MTEKILACVILLCMAASVGGQEPPTQEINRLLAAAWQENGLRPSERTTDAQFLRRVSVDILGYAPSADEIRDFQNDANPDKRARLVARLLKDDAYATHWAYLWTDWLLPASYNAVYRGQMRKWLEGRFAKNTSHKDLVRELLTASGKNTDNGSVHFLLAHTGAMLPKQVWDDDGQFDMKPATVETMRLFHGHRVDCIECHDHPFTADWRQEHFWGLNGLLRQVHRKGLPCASPTVSPPLELYDNPDLNKRGLLGYERRNGVVLFTDPRLPGGKKWTAAEKRPRRDMLADYVVGHANFAPACVNHIWGHFFGHGMHATPAVDDFGEHHELVHPKLMASISKAFADNGHDLKKLIAWICNSEAYQLQSVANATNMKPEAAPYLSRMLKKTAGD